MYQITINSYKNLKIFRKSYHVQTMLMETFGKNRMYLYLLLFDFELQEKNKTNFVENFSCVKMFTFH